MSQIREARVAKRPGHSNGETGKRRAPYALRACDACRRRKGKCDGRQPCKYCSGRDQACSYDSFLGTEEWPQSVVETIQRQEKRAVCDGRTVGPAEPGLGSCSGKAGDLGRALARDKANQFLSIFIMVCHNDHILIASADCSDTSSNNQDAIMEILSSLQGQLNSLASRVHTSSQSPPEPTFEATDCNNEDFLSTLMNDATDIGDYVGAIEQNWQNPARPIYGLPSPDNSLNASSQSRAEPPRGSFSATQSRHQPHLDVTSDIEFNEVVFTRDKASADVIGDLHPIVDIDEVQTRARNCYTDGDSTTWEFFTEPVESASEDDLLILNLALLIGLHADATPSKHESEAEIRESIQPAISSKLAAPRSTMNGVIIILLKGAYDFFNDNPQSAWRMCGTAGRMLMELGFHNGVMSEDMLDSRAQRTEVWALMSSIVIIDRQWSAAAGLPRNFQESAFGPINTSSIKLPYLEAIVRGWPLGLFNVEVPSIDYSKLERRRTLQEWAPSYGDTWSG
ncbi:lea domain protein [Colletotrichum kahawae]|uniref:Lea domain protein n=1 Tax=Colletotrichum kahawae TaxID=34407 RepID=A0AAD9YDR8_COLKA|nr:lea domain protein [Colletotrichum kahawae]